MTSKERVRRAIAHQQTDRVPIDYYARDEISQALALRLGLGPGESLIDRLGVDLRGVGPAFHDAAAPLHYADPTARVQDGVYYDLWGVGFKPNATSAGFYMDLTTSPLRQATTQRDLDRHAWPTADLWDYSTIAEQARAQADYWLWAHSRGIFEISWFLRGFEEFLADVAEAPERAAAVMDHVQTYLFERTRRILDAGAGLIDMVEYNDDVGGQGGMLLSPAAWRQHLKPRMAAFVELCRGHGAKVRYHSCGGVRPILPDLIEVGVDVLNPVQTLAAGMEPGALKRDFGADLTFNGGVDTQDLLPHAPEDVVRRETARLIEVLGHKGGFILAPAHVFQADVPVANVAAVYEVALGHAL